jgi:hypothetical protein
METNPEVIILSEQRTDLRQENRLIDTTIQTARQQIKRHEAAIAVIHENIAALTKQRNNNVALYLNKGEALHAITGKLPVKFAE